MATQDSHRAAIHGNTRLTQSCDSWQNKTHTELRFMATQDSHRAVIDGNTRLTQSFDSIFEVWGGGSQSGVA